MLEDIYVWFDLKSASFHLNLNQSNIVFSAEKIINNTAEYKNCLIIGDEQSGKSSLCQMMAIKLLDNGWVGILVSGHDIKSISYIDTIETRIVDVFNRINDKKKFLIIDDFDKTLLNSEFKIKFFNEIEMKFDKVLLSASNYIKNEDYIHKINFSLYEIMPFTIRCRSQLINNWYMVGALLHKWQWIE